MSRETPPSASPEGSKDMDSARLARLSAEDPQPLRTKLQSSESKLSRQILEAPLEPTAPKTENRHLFWLDAGNWISLTALVISLATAVWQISGFIAGPIIVFIPPTSVTFRYLPLADRDAVALTVSTMNYLNEGRKDYDALIISENVSISFRNRPAFLLNWWWFVSADGSKPEQAHPVVVTGSGLAAHETRFNPLIQPCTDDCSMDFTHRNFVDWDSFLELADMEPAGHQILLELYSKIRERTERVIYYSCTVYLDGLTRERMRAQRALLRSLRESGMDSQNIHSHKQFREYYSLPCRPSIPLN